MRPVTWHSKFRKIETTSSTTLSHRMTALLHNTTDDAEMC